MATGLILKVGRFSVQPTFFVRGTPMLCGVSWPVVLCANTSNFRTRIPHEPGLLGGGCGEPCSGPQGKPLLRYHRETDPGTLRGKPKLYPIATAMVVRAAMMYASPAYWVQPVKQGQATLVREENCHHEHTSSSDTRGICLHLHRTASALIIAVNLWTHQRDCTEKLPASDHKKSCSHPRQLLSSKSVTQGL